MLLKIKYFIPVLLLLMSTATHAQSLTAKEFLNIYLTQNYRQAAQQLRKKGFSQIHHSNKQSTWRKLKPTN